MGHNAPPGIRLVPHDNLLSLPSPGILPLVIFQFAPSWSFFNLPHPDHLSGILRFHNQLEKIVDIFVFQPNQEKCAM